MLSDDSNVHISNSVSSFSSKSSRSKRQKAKNYRIGAIVNQGNDDSKVGADRSPSY